MYESFYGLNDKPFALTPNPRFVFYSQQYREAEGQLLYGVNNREGFMVVTGPPGTGKTTLCRDLIDKLDRGRVHSALIFNPFLNAVEMLAALLTEFGITAPSGASRKDLLDRLNQFLLAQLALGKSCVAIFDEAQHLSAEFLEQIRVLSNLETDQEKLLQIILVGQPELLDRIRSPGMAQLNQRVSIRCALSDLDRQESDRYIHHRLNVAGARGQVRFSTRAVRDIFAAAQGVPRLINLICDRALLAGYADQTRDIGAAHVKKAILALRGEEAGLHNDAKGGRSPGRSRRVLVAVGAAAVLVVACVGWWRLEAGQVTPESLYESATTATRPDAAKAYYSELTRRFPTSTFVPQALVALAQLQMADSEYAFALSSLREADARTENGPEKSRVKVWTALAELSVGDTNSACQMLASRDSTASTDPLLQPQIAAVSSHCDSTTQISAGTVAPDSAGTSTPRARADSAPLRAASRVRPPLGPAGPP
ncbi:MAG TPA: AAA family ATPase [Gemmatimonadaceae bacterium]|nr:AAA family ATPase [Gemmatimonadaceae bacterium]